MFLFYASVLPQAFTVDYHHRDACHKTNQTFKLAKGRLSYRPRVLLKNSSFDSEMRGWDGKSKCMPTHKLKLQQSFPSPVTSCWGSQHWSLLPILLMAWMRQFLSKNRQSLHTHSTMLEKQWVILQHSIQTHFLQQTLLHKTPPPQECLLELPLRTSAPL